MADGDVVVLAFLSPFLLRLDAAGSSFLVVVAVVDLPLDLFAVEERGAAAAASDLGFFLPPPKKLRMSILFLNVLQYLG